MTSRPASSTDPREPDSDLVDALVQSAFVTVAALSRIGTEHDLSLTQLRLLGILRDRRLRMSQLAQYLGLDRSTMSGLVDRAEQRHLVQRTPSADDGRATDVTLTTAGRLLTREVQEKVELALAPLTGALPDADRSHLATLLRQMLDGG